MASRRWSKLPSSLQNLHGIGGHCRPFSYPYYFTLLSIAFASCVPSLEGQALFSRSARTANRAATAQHEVGEIPAPFPAAPRRHGPS